MYSTCTMMGKLNHYSHLVTHLQLHQHCMASTHNIAPKLHNFSTTSILESLLVLTMELAFYYTTGGPGLASTRMSPYWILFELRVMCEITTGAIRGAKLQSKCHHQQTNTKFFTAQMPFLCRPTNSVKALKGNEFL